MKHTSKSLNDLFREAGSEAEGGVLSQSEVERLIENSSVRSVPVTSTIGQRLYRSLLSTPLKIGMTSMTASACVALGIIAVALQLSQPVSENNSVSPYTSKPTTAIANLDKSSALHGYQPMKKLTPLRETGRAKSESLVAKAVISNAPSAVPDTSTPIELKPKPLAQSEAVLPVLDVKRIDSLSSPIVEPNDPPYKESWYVGYVMPGANEITNQTWTAILPSLNIINAIRIGEHETLGLRIGLEFINPIIIAKYLHVDLGVDSRTFFGDGPIRPYIWGQAGVQSVPIAGGGIGFGSYGIGFGAGPGVQYRMASGYSLMVDGGYSAQGPYSAYTLHFGVGF